MVQVIAMTGADLTRWTIWISLAGYALSVGLMLTGRPGEANKRTLARLAWTAGCLFLWLHVAAAFDSQHHWSHAVAYEHTARRTEAVTGVSSGSGIYFNYLTMLLWAADSAWWWISPASYLHRKKLISATVHGWLAFMIINAAIVFETGPVRWLALAVTMLIIVIAVRSKIRD